MKPRFATPFVAAACCAASLLLASGQAGASPAAGAKPAAKAAAAKTAVKPATKATAKAATKPAAKPVVKAAAKPAAKKPQVVAKASPARTTAAAGAGAAALAAPAVGLAALTSEEHAIAEQVHTGDIACELGASVKVAADPHNPGRFHVNGKGFAYHMTPVVSNTGAIRLEDAQRGAVWLQIANKSMLMNHKLGQRLADECKSPQQLQVAEAMKTNPPVNLLETPAGK